MTKSQKQETNHVACLLAAKLADEGYAARALSALARSASEKARNEIITYAARWPAVVQHPDFIL
jgi:hypothetical protein